MRNSWSKCIIIILNCASSATAVALLDDGWQNQYFPLGPDPIPIAFENRTLLLPAHILADLYYIHWQAKWQNAFPNESDLNALNLLCNRWNANPGGGAWQDRSKARRYITCPEYASSYVHSYRVHCNGIQPYNTRRLYRNHLQTMSLCIDKRLSAALVTLPLMMMMNTTALSLRNWFGICVCPIGVRVTNRLSSPSNRNKCLSGAVRVGHLIRTGRDTSSHSLTCIAIIQVAHTFPLWYNIIRVAWMEWPSG